MNKYLHEVFNSLAREYRDNILPTSRYYQEVSIGEQAGKIGLDDVQEKFKGVYAVIPLKHPVQGMKVRIDGRTFVRYAQFESGVAVPGYVARETQLPHKRYIANDSMILNC